MSLVALTLLERQKIQQLVQMKVDNAKKTPGRKIRYVGHPLPEASYPMYSRDEAPAASAAGGTRMSLQVTKTNDKASAVLGTRTSGPAGLMESKSPRAGAGSGQSPRVPKKDEDDAPAPSSPRTSGLGSSVQAVPGPVKRGPAAASGSTASKSLPKTAAKAVPSKVSAAAAASPAEPEGAYQKLRRATVALKSAAEARGAVVAVKGGAEPEKKAGPSAKEIEEAQKTEMRRAAALERKKLREEREKMKSQGGGEEGGGSGRGGGGGGGDSVDAGELEALRQQLEQEVERRAAAEAAMSSMKEKQEADRVTARELKQLAKDYRSKYEEANKEAEEAKLELEELRVKNQEQQEQFEAELSAARSHAAAAAAAAGGGGDELVDDLQV